MGAGHEHHQPEPDLGEEGEGGVGGVQVAQDRPAQEDPHDELTDDNRYVPAAWKCQQRPDQAGHDDDRQHGEVHGHLLSMTSPAAAQGHKHKHAVAVQRSRCRFLQEFAKTCENL